MTPETRPLRSLPSVGLFRHSVAMFLCAIVLLIVAMPFAQHLPDPGLLEGPLLAIVLIAGVLAVGGRRKSLILAIILALPALVVRGFAHYRSDPGLETVALTLAIFLFVQVTAQMLRFIVIASRVDSEVLCAGVATYLLLGLMWTPLYLLVGYLEPQAFALPASARAQGVIDPFNALYFSFVTLTTMGYGDITPVSPFARMLALLQAVTGVLYLSVLIARLVTLYTEKRE